MDDRCARRQFARSDPP